MSNKVMHNIIVISGPSGSGKSTLIARLMEQHPEIIFSTSHTTRPSRGK
jgi:guanylate kinase